MDWIDDLRLERFNLLPGVAPDIIRSVEQRLGVSLPTNYRHFLETADGGILNDFIFYSAGRGIHPEETLLRANLEQDAEFPLLCIGRDASDDFGFNKDSLTSEHHSIYFISHETWQLDKVADSFTEFIKQIASLEPGQPFFPLDRRAARP